jgi:hypothetical protein
MIKFGVWSAVRGLGSLHGLAMAVLLIAVVLMITPYTIGYAGQQSPRTSRAFLLLGALQLKVLLLRFPVPPNSAPIECRNPTLGGFGARK